MSDSAKLYRVVVVGIARGSTTSPQDLAARLSETLPLPDDARLALEAGRSAVVQRAAPEPYARRTATLIIKLGAEVRIEPDDQATAPATGGLDFGMVDLPDLGAGPEIAPGTATGGVEAERLDPTLPPPPGHPAPADLVDLPALEVGAPDAPAPAPEAGVAAAGVRPRLVRCPAHGLLYDAATSPGCNRCLGQQPQPGFRLAPGLRSRPRLWLGAGLALGLLLGAVPAALYAESVKNGALLERRIEAEAIRRGRVGTVKARQAYAEARKRVDKVRTHGIALSALLWLGTATLLLFLWLRFV